MRSNSDREDYPFGTAQNEIAIDPAPFAASRRATQMVLTVVHSVAAIPIVIMDPVSSLPLLVMMIPAIVMAISLCLIAAIMVWMVLSDHGRARKSKSQQCHEKGPHRFMKE